MSKLEPVLESHHEIKNTLNSLSENLGGYVDELWGALEAREDVLEEYKKQKEDEEVQRLVSSLEDRLKGKEEECVEQSALLDTSTRDLEGSRKMVQELEAVIHELEKNLANSQDTAVHLQQLREEHERVESELETKATRVKDLQSQVLENNAANKAEREKYQKDIETLRKTLDQRMEEVKEAQVQAVETAQHDAFLKMSEIRADLEKQLSKALDERTALQSELEKARKRMRSMESDNQCW